MTMTKASSTRPLKDESRRRKEKSPSKDLVIIENNNKQEPHLPSFPIQPDHQIVAENIESIAAERLPFISVIPINKKNKLKLLSWKLPDTKNKNDKIRRYQGIVDELGLISNKMAPDVILLQEFDQQMAKGENAEELLTKIQKKLGKNYYIVLNEQNKAATSNKTITLYHKTTFHGGARRRDEGEHNVFGDKGYDLLILKTGQKVSIKNVNAQPSRTPIAHEVAIKDFLQQGKQDKIIHIVAGNFNCPSSKSLNINSKINTACRSTADLELTEKYGQAHFHSEGAFYINLDTNLLCQAKVEPINIQTGIPFDNKALEKFIKEATQKEKSIVPQLASTMRIDDDSALQKIVKIGNEKFLSLIEIEILLRGKLGNLAFRYATNFYDSHGISALGLSKVVYAELQKLFPDFEYEEVQSVVGKKVRIVSANEARSLQLIKALQAILLIQKLPALREEKSKLYQPLVNLIMEVSRDNNISHEQAENFYAKCLRFLDDEKKEDANDLVNVNEIFSDDMNHNISHNVDNQAEKNENVDILENANDENITENGLRFFKTRASFELSQKLKGLKIDREILYYINAEIKRHLDDDTIILQNTFLHYDRLTALIQAKLQRRIKNRSCINQIQHFTEENLAFFHKLFPTVYVSYQVVSQSQSQDQLIAPPHNMTLFDLNKALRALPLINKLQALPEQPEIVSAVSNLILTVTKDKSINEKQASAVFDHFIEPLDAIKNNRRIIQKQIDATGDVLNKLLHHASTTHIMTRMAILGALGAVAGFVIGGLVGSIFTLGLGGLPAAGVGALLGMALCGGEGAIAGGTLLAWRQYKKELKNKNLSKNYQSAYNKATDAIKAMPTLFKPERLNKNSFNPNQNKAIAKKDMAAEGNGNQI